MKSNVFILLATIIFIFNSCTNGQSVPSNSSVSALEFSKKITLFPNAPIIDVRTPGEFSQGHLKNAINYDISSSGFEKQIASLDKSKPVLVYCLTGSRSMYALKYMQSIGFKQVFELSGGILKWRASGLPEPREHGLCSDQFCTA